MDRSNSSTTVLQQPGELEQGICTFQQPQQTVESTGAAVGPGHLKEAALKAYTRQTRKIRQDNLILEFLPMVHKIVQRIVSFLRPPLSREDLISAGTIGLVKAARDFDPSHDARFKTYAYIRIRGAVLDELRGWSFTPTTVKKHFDRARQIAHQLTEKTGKEPSDEDLAEKLGIPVRKVYKIFEDARARHFLSIHGISDQAPALGSALAAPDTTAPGDRMERAELADELAGQISNLPRKQRRIIILYYHEELTMKQIARVLKITESRVSQLHASALFRLSIRMRQWDDRRP